MNKQTVLLVGTSFSAMPLLKYLKSLNYIVAVCGNLKDDPCHKIADYSFYINYSDKDELLKLCQNKEFDYIIPTCNDYSYNSASYVASKLDKFYGFDPFEITNLLHTKNAFRNFTIKNNISVPQAIKFKKEIDLEKLLLKYPLLVKPDDSSSGKGVTKVIAKEQLLQAIQIAKNNSRNEEVVIEEFVDGNLYSHSAFIQNGKIIIDFFVNEYCTVYPYQVDSSCIAYCLNNNLKIEVRKEIQKLVDLLELSDGLLHTQFIADDNNFWLIETMRRCPGDLYGTLIKKSTGIEYSKFYIAPFLNQKNTINNLDLNIQYVARHTISVSKNIVFKSFSSSLDFKRLDVYPLKESGQVLNKAPYDKVGIAFYQFDSEDKLMNNTEKMKEYFYIDCYEEMQSDK